MDRIMTIVLICVYNYIGFSQGLELEGNQATSWYKSNNTTNGSVLVLQNITSLNPLSLSNYYYGAINFVDSLNETPGQIGYQSINFLGSRLDKMNFRINNSDIMTLSENGALTMSNGAFCSEGGVWTDACSATYKNLVQKANGSKILDKLSKLPIYHWSYKSNPQETHIGPTAEDFHRLFNTGISDKNLAAIDLGGVSLAAVQELHFQITELKKEISELKKYLAKKYRL